MADEGHSSRRIGWLALSLFVGGLLLPFALYELLKEVVKMPIDRSSYLSLGVGAVCELMALIFGVVGWRHPNGKVAGIGSGALIGLTLFVTVAFFFR